MPSAANIDAKVKRWLTPNWVWIVYLAFGAAYSAFFTLGVQTEDNSILELALPANAFMLGMLVRFPVLARPMGWIVCLAGFVAAIPIVGFGFAVGARLALYNFGVVAIGYSLLSRFDRVDQRLERPTSVFYLLSAVVAASLFAGVVGAILLGPLFSNPAIISNFRYWFSIELLNQLAFLPMILAFPEPRQWVRQLPLTLHDQAPVAVLALSVVMGILSGGVAALVFPVPALLWCAISYPVFLTALLTFAFCAWAVLATTLSYVDLPNLDQSLALSISMGVAFISLGPLIISTTTATRNEVLEQLRELAAEREIVSNELEHRIKNLFALVNGLISLSVRDNPDMKPLAKTLRNRLLALQHAHGLIRTGNASPGAASLTSLKGLIGTLLRPYESDAGSQFVIAGDDVFVDSGTITLLALVFHELATNSTKYGALSDPDGALEVHISHNIEELHIKWSEMAPRLIGQPDAAGAGFGSKLLELTIKSQLRGSYTRKWTVGRIDIAIILPRKLFYPIPQASADLAEKN